MARGPEVVVLNGDTWFDVDLERLFEFRRSSAKPIAVALKPMRDFDRYGTVEMAPDGTISAFHEKRPCADGLINGGVYAIDCASGIFDGLSGSFSFETGVLEPQCAAGRLCGLVQHGYFIDIGIPEDYARAGAAPELLRHPDTLSGIVRALEGVDTLLLDRDGVINRLRPGDYVKSISEFEWIPGAREALAEAASKFSGIYIVTNQRGVGRGVMTHEALDSVHAWMLQEIVAAGGRVDGIYVCTAVEEDNPCRKPNRGLFDELLAGHPEIMPSRTVMIGDSESDALFARNCGIDFFFAK